MSKSHRSKVGFILSYLIAFTPLQLFWKGGNAGQSRGNVQCKKFSFIRGLWCLFHVFVGYFLSKLTFQNHLATKRYDASFVQLSITENLPKNINHVLYFWHHFTSKPFSFILTLTFLLKHSICFTRWSLPVISRVITPFIDVYKPKYPFIKPFYWRFNSVYNMS